MKKHIAPPLRDGVAKNSYVRKKPPGEPLPPSPLSPLGGGEGEGDTPRADACGGVVKQIKSLAHGLSVEERNRLLAELSLQAQEADLAATRDVDMWAAAVYAALVDANGGRSGAVPGPAIVRRALTSVGSWTVVRGFMHDAKFNTLSVVERSGVYRMLAGLVVNQAQYISQNTHQPLSPKLIANCAHNVGSLFDQSFPGYLKAGLALIVARRLNAGAIVASETD